MSERIVDPNPLRELEERALDSTKLGGVNFKDGASRAHLRHILENEVARWSQDYRRGLVSVDIADPPTLVDRAFRNLAEYGPLTELLNDPNVWEIMINAPDQIFVRRHAGRSGYHDEVFHDDDHVVRTLTKLLEDAASSHRKLDPAEGLQDARLDDGSRLHIVHGDLTRGGHLIVNIRRFTGVAFTSLQQLVDNSTLSEAASRFIRACARARLSVIFSGSPGSGKTTLLSCTVAELDPSLRVVVAEEVLEADIALPNVAQLQTRPARGERPAVDLRRLVAGFLRMAPDVAIVGEVRDREALPLLLTLSSGVTGFTTIHAGSAKQALSRLRFICQLAETSSELSLTALNQLVTDAVDVVVHSQRTDSGPRVSEVVCVEEQTTSLGSTQFTTTQVFTTNPTTGNLEPTGLLPVRALNALSGLFDVRDLAVTPHHEGRW